MKPASNDQTTRGSVQYYRIDSGIEGVLPGVVRSVSDSQGDIRYEVLDPFAKDWIEFSGASRVDRPDNFDSVKVSTEEGLALAEACINRGTKNE